MIEVQQVSKAFENEYAVENLSLSIRKGSIYGLLGSNGAGKTTLLKIIAGVYRPEAGSITINEKPVYENVPVKQRMVFIPDTLYFFPHSTIKQMANYYANFYPDWNWPRFEKLQQVFNIDPKRKINRLSKGMKRQVAFWLALSCMPDVLILDEPIDGLDPVMRQKIKNLLFQDVAERDLTVIISSHNLREIEDICDHVGIMHNGKLIIQKELDDLKADTHKIQIAFSEQQQDEELLSKLKILHQDKRGSVSLFIVKGKQMEIEQIIHTMNPLLFDILPLSLEEIFIYEMEDIGYEIKNVLL